MSGTKGANGSPSILDTALDRLDRWSERISFEMFRFGLYVTMPALVVLVSLDVTLRYVFNAPLQWARDVNGILLLISIFCALPHAWDRGYHIRMEVFYSRFSRRRRRIADIVSSLSGIIFFGLMAWQAARFVPFMIQTGETGEDLEAPLWPYMAILSICAVVVLVRIFSNPAATEKYLHHPTVSDREGPSEGEQVRLETDWDTEWAGEGEPGSAKPDQQGESGPDGDRT